MPARRRVAMKSPPLLALCLAPLLGAESRGRCEDDGERAASLAGALGLNAEGCEGSSALCRHPLVAAACCRTCSGLAGDPTSQAMDGLRRRAQLAGPPARSQGRVLASLSADGACADDDGKVANMANALGFVITNCQQASFLCSLDVLAGVDFAAEYCPATCGLCGSDDDVPPGPDGEATPSPTPWWMAPTPAPTYSAGCADTNNGSVGLYELGCIEFNSPYMSWDGVCWASGEYDDDDFTASAMCCACGGGERDPTPAPPPSQAPTPMPTPWWMAPTPAPTIEGCAGTANGTVGRYDYDCQFFSSPYMSWDGVCWASGEYDDDDFTASAMCCACGGGERDPTPAPPPSRAPTPMPTPWWMAPTPVPTIGGCADIDNGAIGLYDYGCDFFAQPYMSWEGFCFGADEFDDTDFTANVMCCACGGGETVPTQAPTPAPPTSAPTPMPPTPSPPPTDECQDTSNGAIGILGFGCEIFDMIGIGRRMFWGSGGDFYANGNSGGGSSWSDDGSDAAGADGALDDAVAQACEAMAGFDTAEFKASAMCCACGGGSTSPVPAPEPSPEWQPGLEVTTAPTPAEACDDYDATFSQFAAAFGVTLGQCNDGVDFGLCELAEMARVCCKTCSEQATAGGGGGAPQPAPPAAGSQLFALSGFIRFGSTGTLQEVQEVIRDVLRETLQVDEDRLMTTISSEINDGSSMATWQVGHMIVVESYDEAIALLGGFTGIIEDPGRWETYMVDWFGNNGLELEAGSLEVSQMDIFDYVDGMEVPGFPAVSPPGIPATPAGQPAYAASGSIRFASTGSREEVQPIIWEMLLETLGIPEGDERLTMTLEPESGRLLQAASSSSTSWQVKYTVLEFSEDEAQAHMEVVTGMIEDSAAVENGMVDLFGEHGLELVPGSLAVSDLELADYDPSFEMPADAVPAPQPSPSADELYAVSGSIRFDSTGSLEEIQPIIWEMLLETLGISQDRLTLTMSTLDRRLQAGAPSSDASSADQAGATPPSSTWQADYTVSDSSPDEAQKQVEVVAGMIQESESVASGMVELFGAHGLRLEPDSLAVSRPEMVAEGDASFDSAGNFVPGAASTTGWATGAEGEDRHEDSHGSSSPGDVSSAPAANSASNNGDQDHADHGHDAGSHDSQSSQLYIVGTTIRFDSTGALEEVEAAVRSTLLAALGVAEDHLGVTVTSLGSTSGRRLVGTASTWQVEYTVTVVWQEAQAQMQKAMAMSQDPSSMASGMKEDFRGRGLTLDAETVVVTQPEMRPLLGSGSSPPPSPDSAVSASTQTAAPQKVVSHDADSSSASVIFVAVGVAAGLVLLMLGGLACRRLKRPPTFMNNNVPGALEPAVGDDNSRREDPGFLDPAVDETSARGRSVEV